APVNVNITVDNRSVETVPANLDVPRHPGHGFSTAVPMTSGRHTICAIGINVGYGAGNSPPACRTLSFTFSPLGDYTSLTRASDGSNALLARGYAFDPDTTGPISVALTVDGVDAGTTVANHWRADVGRRYPRFGHLHGFAAQLAADSGEHTVCVVAQNVGGGSDTNLGCKTVIAVHPHPPWKPRDVTASPGFGSANVSWDPPASDGGAPWTKFIVTASPGGKRVTVPGTSGTAVVTGLRSKTAYTFSVVAVNVAGSSNPTVSNRITTLAGPPPQRTPAPVSTSRYVRNVSGSSPTDLAKMRHEGYADAQANPSGHAYMILLAIGGQDQADGGVVLTATTRFVSYGDIERDLRAYVTGYHRGQRATAPVTIAIGTNNDMDVSAASGRTFANKIVGPLRHYASQYDAITVAGSDDMEPGFRATYRQSLNWLSGYLSASTGPFVFHGSADGCSWTQPNRRCNNGWLMIGLYRLAAGASPTRIVDLPQIYNDNMAGQWKYISLTGISHGLPRINFVGPLTEFTACRQAGSCGSLTGHSAWSVLWRNLQSNARLKVNSLPYSTDLRIDR
ncbi:MAG: fibronectin type III domain-containing protein, partial [Mycobacterium sp.]|nr:fibronectin type III domain-containing protein [Mycobacterium sp.]